MLDTMRNAGQALAVVLQTLQVTESTFEPWRRQFGGMKSHEETKRLRVCENEHKRLKQLIADLSLDNQTINDIASKTGKPFSNKNFKTVASLFSAALLPFQ